MPAAPAASVLLLSLGAAGAAIGLAVLAAVLLGRAAEERDMAARMRIVLRPAERGAAAAGGGPRLAAGLLRPVRRLGEALRATALVSAREQEEFQRALAAAGIDPRRGLSVFIGVKALLVGLSPLLGLGAVLALDLEGLEAAGLLGGTLALGVIGPNWAIGALRRPFQNRLRRGLPDAFDLLVVAAEAGLGLETALDRVGREMAGSNAAIAVELNTLVQELRMMPDRTAALERMAERSELEGFKRLAATLSQTLRFGTPLAQALRVLAADMRNERMLRMEEKAMRLPAMLIGPLILFILPALFIALIGPSIIELSQSFGGPSQ